MTRSAAATLISRTVSHLLTQLSEGFSHFTTSMTAPVASGWSDGRVGLAPTGKTSPYHGAHPLRKLTQRTSVVSAQAYLAGDRAPHGTAVLRFHEI